MAISPQVFPASLMIFSLCSSAGLQGVFVLLFFGAGAGTDSSPVSSVCSSRLPGSPRPPVKDDIVDMPVGGPVPGALRFLEGGELTEGCGAR